MAPPTYATYDANTCGVTPNVNLSLWSIINGCTNSSNKPTSDAVTTILTVNMTLVIKIQISTTNGLKKEVFKLIMRRAGV